MPKTTIADWLIRNLADITDYFNFSLSVLLGQLVKIYEYTNTGKRISVRKFFFELATTFFIAITVYAIFDQFLNMNKLFTYMTCAWAGSISSTIRTETKELAVFVFQGIKLYLNNKFNK